MLAWLSRVEVLIAIVAFSLLAVLTVPRGVDAAVSQPGDELRDAQEVVQNAIDRYALDHHTWPGATQADEAAASEALLEQLTSYTNAAGQTSSTRDDEFRYGPYLASDGVSAEVLTQFAQTASTQQSPWSYNSTNGRFSISE